MWLINTKSKLLEEFIPEQAPPYAILSHRWEEDEVLFRHMQDQRIAQSKKGYRKILQTCIIAARDCHAYVWIDTCCINKESSAELSEAINSMYEWYSRSQVCYTYLSDVSSFPLNESEFRKSAWFTRGWTLQELIASPEVVFLNRDWQNLGRKVDILDLLEQITTIHRCALGETSPSEFPVAVRMSWAARRTTTRREDIAYCLLGLFDVNMPLLYGEGEKAFIRLQEEIIRRNDDHSILVWYDSRATHVSGVFAPHPRCFQNSIVPTSIAVSERALAVCFEHLSHTSNHVLIFPSPSILANQGVSVKVLLRPWSPGIYRASFDSSWGYGNLPAVFLKQDIPGNFTYWHTVHDPTFDVADPTTLRRWRAWRHQPCAQLRNQLSPIVIGLKPPPRSKIHDYMLRHPYTKRGHGFSVEITEELGSWIKNVTFTKSANHYYANQPFSSDHFETLTETFCGSPIEADLELGETGVVIMLETRDTVVQIRRIGLGVDFEGEPFLIAAKREKEYRSKQAFAISSPGLSTDELEMCHMSTLEINHLIDEDLQHEPLKDNLTLRRLERRDSRREYPERHATRDILSKRDIWALRGYQKQTLLPMLSNEAFPGQTKRIGYLVVYLSAQDPESPALSSVKLDLAWEHEV